MTQRAYGTRAAGLIQRSAVLPILIGLAVLLCEKAVFVATATGCEVGQSCWPTDASDSTLNEIAVATLWISLAVQLTGIALWKPVRWIHRTYTRAKGLAE
jgi:hypothetical protein